MRKKSNLLTIFIFAGIFLGVLVGQFVVYDASLAPDELAARARPWQVAGEFILIRPLKLMIVPLVFTCVLTGITSIGDPKRLGLLGGATLILYVLSMIVASTIGVTLATIIQPGAGIPEDVKSAGMQAGAGMAAGAPQDVGSGVSEAWLGILRLMVPDNALKAAVEGQALSVITATILLGVALMFIGARGRPFVQAVESLHEALMTIVRWILWLMPVGVFVLVTWAVGHMGLSKLAAALGLYVATVVSGLTIQMFLVLPAALWVLGRVNPYRFMWAMRPALLTAFGTASSMATLPLTIETATDAGGCSRRASALSIPLGATINMDGTALYQGVAVMFLFQAFGYDLHFTQQLVIVLTAVLSAIGAAGIPGGSLATTFIIIAAVNTTLEGSGREPLPESAIGVILGVDRILDMCRTTVNVWGDCIVARILTRVAPDEEEAREAAFA